MLLNIAQQKLQNKDGYDERHHTSHQQACNLNSAKVKPKL